MGRMQRGKIILLGVGAAVAYGIIHDQITAHCRIGLIPYMLVCEGGRYPQAVPAVRPHSPARQGQPHGGRQDTDSGKDD